MKKLIVFILVLASLQGLGQINYTSTRYLGLPRERSYIQGVLEADTAFLMPIRDTTFTPWAVGIQVYRTADSSVYVSKATTTLPRWQKLATGSGLSGLNINSVAYATSTTNIATGTNFNWDNSLQKLTVGTDGALGYITSNAFLSLGGGVNISEWATERGGFIGLYNHTGAQFPGYYSYMVEASGGTTGTAEDTLGYVKANRFRLKEKAAAATPASGEGVLYVKTDNLLYFKNDAGTEYNLTAAGSGSGTVNSGTANNLTYYPSTGTTVDDASGLTWDNTSKALEILNASGTTGITLNGSGSAGINFSNLSTLKAGIGWTNSTSTFGIDALGNKLSLESDEYVFVAGALGTAWYASTLTTSASPTSDATTYKLGVLAANSTITLPSAATYSGRHIELWNTNTSGTFSWSTAAAYKKPDGTTSTALTNGKYYIFRSDGTNWVRIMESDYSSSGGGTPAGSDRDIQINNSGAFGVASNFKIDASNILLLGYGANQSTGAKFEINGYMYAEGFLFKGVSSAEWQWNYNGGAGGMVLKNIGVGDYFTFRPAELVVNGTSDAGNYALQVLGAGYFTGQLTLNTQFTPSTSTDATHAAKTLTVDDTYLWYRNSAGTWKKIAWTAF